MYSECYINTEQRGILKDMILDHDTTLKDILYEYECSRDKDKLYTSIVDYSKNKLNYR
jgi:hypothetical protein